MQTTQKPLGHVNLQMTARYLRSDAKVKQAAVGRLAAVFGVAGLPG